jgi:hypothetical protein
MTIWRMRIAGWIPKATNTHSKYVIIIAFPLQERLHEHGPMKRQQHTACLVQRLFKASPNYDTKY